MIGRSGNPDMTSILLKPRHVVAALCSIGSLFPWFASAQDLVHRPPPPSELKLVQIGNGKTKSGVKTGFRVYEAPNGNQGRVVYVKFDSFQAAQQQIENWAKLPSVSFTSREHDQYRYGVVVSDRILAVGKLPGSHKKEFLIIRRDDLRCFLIESASLQVVGQIEDLIQYK